MSVTALRGRVADKPLGFVSSDLGNHGKFHRFKAQVGVVTFKTKYPQLRNREAEQEEKRLGIG